MFGKLNDRGAGDLRDAQLSALLREAFADAPALAESPGRTDHIMRKILSAGVMPMRRRLPWGLALAWASGGLALAGATLLLTVALLRAPANHGTLVASNPSGTPQTTTVQPPVNPPVTPPAPTPVSDVAQHHVSSPVGTRVAHGTSERHQRMAAANVLPATTDTDDDAVKVAAALCETGSTAYSTGDYQTAYDAYEAAYQTSPTYGCLDGLGESVGTAFRQNIAGSRDDGYHRFIRRRTQGAAARICYLVIYHFARIAKQEGLAMKLLCWIMLGALLALPALAQAKYLEGQVREVGPRQATLTVAVTAASPDAPGKVPDKFAAKAARLEDQAQQLDKKKKHDLAGKLREKVRQLRCQREVDFVVRESDPITISGVNAAALNTVKRGMTLTMEVSAPGTPQSAPSHVTLIHTARQARARAPRGLRALPNGPNDPNSYYQLTGVVLSTAPVTLDVAGQQLTVDDPNALGFTRRSSLTMSTLRAGQKVLIAGYVNAAMQVAQVSKIIVFNGATDITYDQLGNQ